MFCCGWVVLGLDKRFLCYFWVKNFQVIGRKGNSCWDGTKSRSPAGITNKNGNDNRKNNSTGWLDYWMVRLMVVVWMVEAPVAVMVTA